MTVLLVLVFSVQVYGGLVGWLTSKAEDWQFIQSTGGVHIVGIVEKHGKEFLAVDYFPEYNSGLVVRRVSLKRDGGQLVIRIFTQLVEKDSDTSRIHFADISAIPPGSYEVYYSRAGDREAYLGRVSIR